MVTPDELAEGIVYNMQASREQIEASANAGLFGPVNVPIFTAYWSGESHGVRPAAEWASDFWPAYFSGLVNAPPAPGPVPEHRHQPGFVVE